MLDLKNSKLIHYLQTLKKNELSRFAKSLRSPYFNHSESIYDLYAYLRKQWPDFKSSNIKRELVFKKVFGKQPYDYKMLENHQTRLTGLLQQFLLLEELEASSEKEMLHLKMLQTRGLDVYFEGEVKKVKGRLDGAGRRDMGFHLTQYKSNDLQLFHPYIDTPNSDTRLHQNLVHHLDSFYILSSLKLACEQFMAQRDLNSALMLPFFAQVEAMAESPIFKDEPILQIYRLNIKLFRQAEHSTFQELKVLLLEHLGKMEFLEKETIFNYALAHAGFLGLSKPAYWLEYFDLYKLGFEEGILNAKGRVLPAHFINATVLAAALKEIIWLSAFLERETPHLPVEDQEKCGLLGRSYLAFAEGDFEACIRCLHQVEAYKRDPYYALRVFPLELRANYELAAKFNGDDFLGVWKRYKRYLVDNDVISDKRQAANINFLKVAKKLYKGIFKATDKVLFIKEIQGLEPMICKKWCLLKLGVKGQESEVKS